MKIRGKRREDAHPSLPVVRRHSGGAIEISASRWSPVINRIVSDPPWAATCESISRPVQGGSLRMQIRGGRTVRGGRGEGNLGSSCRAPSPPAPFHPPLSLFSLRSHPTALRSYEHKENFFRPVTVSPRGCLPRSSSFCGLPLSPKLVCRARPEEQLLGGSY